MRRFTGVLLSLALLLCGGLIYLLWRPDSLLMFHWINALGLTALVHSLRAATAAMGAHLPAFVLYSLPDGLWLLSMLVLIDQVFKRRPRAAFFIGLALAIAALGHEAAQAFVPALGTFSWPDIAAYCAASLYLVIPLRRLWLKRVWLKKDTSDQTAHRQWKAIPSTLLTTGVIVGYALLAAGSGDAGPNSLGSAANCKVTNLTGDGDVKMINGDPDYGYTIKFHVTNAGEKGAMQIEPWLSTSEGQWTKKQELIFDAGQMMDVEYFFSEPTINATNIQYGYRCSPSKGSDK